MNRRRALAAIAGAGLTGGSALILQSDAPFADSDGFPVRVEGIDAPGSEDGPLRVPRPDRPTLVDCFATWCAPCDRQMEVLTALYPEFEGAIAFASVTSERVGGGLAEADIADWWARRDGDWPVAVDPESSVMSAVGADGLPYLALVDADGAVQWRHSGLASGERLRSAFEAVLEG
ncbi:TlpA family protein disulfide reductase [Halosimplex rubrum]|uniref:TlpA family protein disulfide reductase n=1 Tax=Halosimplex rubrum TaxID=869889 RepID=A0A7D5T8C6_9EURY|nr:TlpA disulfide reductase family protein [Halosimplex rubrum]QLH78995.1 TlpA family protein disulfide reductase [Halosimplex rubrum]